MTESNYLKSFDDVSFTLRFVSDKSTDPVNLMNSLVERAKELELSEEYEDKAFCLIDADMNPIVVAPHATMTVYLKTDKPIKEGAYLRVKRKA